MDWRKCIGVRYIYIYIFVFEHYIQNLFVYRGAVGINLNNVPKEFRYR